MKQTITSIFVNDKTKDGKPYRTHDGKKFKRVVIKVAPDENNPHEWDNQYLSAVIFNDTDPILGWQVGDNVDIKVYQKGGYWNFSVPSRLDRLEKRVETLEAFMAGGNGGSKPEKKQKVENSQPSSNKEEFEDLPF